MTPWHRVQSPRPPRGRRLSHGAQGDTAVPAMGVQVWEIDGGQATSDRALSLCRCQRLHRAGRLQPLDVHPHAGARAEEQGPERLTLGLVGWSEI